MVVVGFSQGAAQAYRVALAAGPACAGVVVLGGDVPPDVAARAEQLPPVLIGRGSRDPWYSADALAADVATLRGAASRGRSASSTAHTSGPRCSWWLRPSGWTSGVRCAASR